MTKLYLILYNVFFIYPFYLVVKILSFFNSKVRTGIEGRKDFFKRLPESLAKLDMSKKTVWFHSSSLGEFEQAKPIIEKIKSEGSYNIFVTFFSPSGYTNSLRYPYADAVSYIPFDSYSNAKRFTDLLKPSLAVFMRYDYWPNHIYELYRMQIPIIIVDATMRDSSPRHSFFARSFHSNLYSKISKILTVSANDVNNFKRFGIEDSKLLSVGDTRFDRVYQRSLIAKGKNLVNESIVKDKFVFVLGSTWDEDEAVMIPVVLKLMERNPNILVIIAPHEPTVLHLEKLENDFHVKFNSVRFSNLNNYKNEQVILVDSIGILLTLYYYASCAFVGGSFKSSIHNVLEAAVYGIPVLYGPKINSSQEAKQLASLGGGVIIRSQREAYKQLRKLNAESGYREEKGRISRDYVFSNIGATDKIYSEIINQLGT
ncbi:MAG: glycosyltransferase N-terminal domain-containing protein [Ignavibacteriaceae bacterium]|nr:glycosyltransferase N-terminal domain-containing protein [Ignavibacteriaceae bacterium]HPO55175.1 glycosyltransferase N-terminal domain-containing protein [Ignavibacteriaceae bacterium]